MLEIYFTDHEALAAAEDLPEAARSAFSAEHVPGGMPFFLDGDGRYDHDLNAFLRDLPLYGCHSARSWRACAYDLRSLASYLSRSGSAKGFFEVDFEDLKGFQRQRLGREVTASSFNRAIAFLEKAFDWAVERGIREATPFKYAKFKGAWRDGPMPRGRNVLLGPVGDDDRVKCVSGADFAFFRNVGLRGMRSDDQRTRDPEFGARYGERNAIIADVLVNTGMRVTEALAMLCCELPPVGAEAPMTGSREMRVADAVAKRGHGRRIWMPNRLLGALGRYRARERGDALAHAGRSGLYSDPGRRWVPAKGATSESCRVLQGGGYGKMKLNGVDAALRRRLVLEDDGTRGPAALWLGYDGVPLTADALRAAFARACERCERLGRPVQITPHVLRHTFAVRMLSVLVRRTFECSAGQQPGRPPLVELTMDPVKTVRDLLGHRSIETTWKYLTYIEDTQRQIAEAFHDLDAELAGLADRLPAATGAQL